MKLLSISDVHIGRDRDENYNLFCQALAQAVELRPTHFILLGDIFDFMVGPYHEYEDYFSESFQALKKLQQKISCQIVYVEGNHDFNLRDLLKYFSQKFDLKIEYARHYYEIHTKSGKVLYAHGDEDQLGNALHKNFKKALSSQFFQNLLKLVFSFRFILPIGNYLARRSRKKNLRYMQDEKTIDGIRKIFRRSALHLGKKRNAQVVVFGHSHIEDYYQENGVTYLNGGFFPHSQKLVIVHDTASSLLSCNIPRRRN